MTNSSEDLRRKAEINANRSGFALELYIHSILSTKPYHILSNHYFLDYDENKSRSLDLSVRSMGSLETKAHHVFIQMDIECKKSENNSWVFFLVDHFISLESSGQFIDYYHMLTSDFDSESSPWDLEKKFNLHYGKELDYSPIATSFTVIKKGTEDPKDNPSKDEIFEAINQVLKYISYHSGQKINIWKQRSPSKTSTYPLLMVHYPVIVFDGSLYSGRLTGDKVKITEQDMISLQYQFRPHYAKTEKNFYIDIVKKEYFETYLEKIEEEVRLIEAVVDKHADMMFTTAENLYEQNMRIEDKKLEDKYFPK